MQNHFDKNYYFGGVYSNYDDFLNWERVVRDLIKNFKFGSFLDIGCGCGNLVKEMRNQKPEVNAWGIDISEFAIKRANADFIVMADCRKLPFEDNRFDMVHILGTFSYLSNLSDIKRAIKEACRVAKKIILFDDVYLKPNKKSEDYDSYRKQVFSQEKWISLWREMVGENNTIKTHKDEIIIKKYV